MSAPDPGRIVARDEGDVTEEQVLQEFRAAGAILEGHFILSSGRRSPLFLQKAFVFSDPVRTERVCRGLAQAIRARFGEAIDLIVSPAVGAVIPGYETARQLGTPAIYAEREKGKLQLRRGFQIPNGARVVVVEDIVTTGLSARECVTCVREAGGRPIAVAVIIDRSGGETDVGAPLLSLARFNAPSYDADDLPADLAAIPARKPGSRGLR